MESCPLCDSVRVQADPSGLRACGVCEHRWQEDPDQEYIEAVTYIHKGDWQRQSDGTRARPILQVTEIPTVEDPEEVFVIAKIVDIEQEIYRRA